MSPVDEHPPELTLASYQAMSASHSRNYDRAQDISPRQMLILLEVCERTGASLGQMLATGEHESAHTWNNHVRPTLNNGNLGSATGVWQFMPSTFHRIVKLFGTQLLAASEVEAAAGRGRLDLGEGPFSDEQVRRLIQETVDGKRSADDDEIQLLRSNFAVLAFAKHYLSVESGATTPEEDYLYHFLGSGQGRRVLALARGAARNTLCVKPVEVPLPQSDTPPALAEVSEQAPSITTATALPSASLVTVKPRFRSQVGLYALPSPYSPPGPYAPPRVSALRGLTSSLQRPAFERGIATTMKPRVVLDGAHPLAADPAIWSPVDSEVPRPVSSEWGLPADSPTVTGNLGMFYRDGKAQSQPYTWAEFMDNLARRVRAKDQPALVRAKFAVGFALKGGDLPARAFNPENESQPVEFHHEISGSVQIPESLATGPLGPDEARHFKMRLSALVSQGEDQPLETLPPEAQLALHHLRMLSSDIQEVSTAHPEVQKALRHFRKLVGKDEPDDPSHLNRLMPVERIALEIYDRRLARYAALQAGQQASLDDAADLSRIKTMPAGLRRSAAPHIASLQTALVAQGLLKQPTQKVVWRDKKRKKHVTYKTVPFTGTAGTATVAAFKSFQWRNGLLNTQGVLDAVTLAMLSLPPMGPEIFRPLSGPYCVIEEEAETASLCETIPKNMRSESSDVISNLSWMPSK